MCTDTAWHSFINEWLCLSLNTIELKSKWGTNLRLLMCYFKWRHTFEAQLEFLRILLLSFFFSSITTLLRASFLTFDVKICRSRLTPCKSVINLLNKNINIYYIIPFVFILYVHTFFDTMIFYAYSIGFFCSCFSKYVPQIFMVFNFSMTPTLRLFLDIF